MSILSLLNASKKVPKKPAKTLGSGSGPMGLELDKDTGIDFLESKGLITPKQAQRRREDESAKYTPGTAKQKRERAQGVAQRRRAEDAGTPEVSLTQTRLKNPRSWESRSQSLRKQLGSKPGDDLDSLMKSSLYVLASGDNTVDDEVFTQVAEKLKTREGRQQLERMVSNFRKANKAKDLPFTEEAYKQAVSQGLTAVKGKNGEVIELMDAARMYADLGIQQPEAVQETPDEQAVRERGNQITFTGKYDVMSKDEQTADMQAGFQGLRDDVAKAALALSAMPGMIDPTGIYNKVTEPVREVLSGLAADTFIDFPMVPFNLARVADTEIPWGDRLSSGLNVLLALVPGFGEALVKGGGKVLKTLSKSEDVALALNSLEPELRGAVIRAASATDDALEASGKTGDDLIGEIQKRLGEDTPNPDVPGAIDVNALPRADDVAKRSESPSVPSGQPIVQGGSDAPLENPRQSPSSASDTVSYSAKNKKYRSQVESELLDEIERVKSIKVKSSDDFKPFGKYHKKAKSQVLSELNSRLSNIQDLDPWEEALELARTGDDIPADYFDALRAKHSGSGATVPIEQQLGESLAGRGYLEMPDGSWSKTPAKLDDAITKFQKNLDQDIPNPDVPGAIDVNALPKDPQVDELPGVQFRQPEDTPGVTFRQPEPPKTPPVEDVPEVKPEAPKSLPKEKPKATGLANQVQDREALDGIIKEVEKTKGKSAEDWQKAGKAKVDDGADFEALAKRVGEGEEELTGEAVGILTEGKRLLLNDVNRKADALKADPKNFRLQKDLADAEERLQDYVQNVQAGKGRWSDVGRALQSGTTVDEGNFADIIQRAERTGNKLSDKQKAEVSKWADEVKKRDEQIAKLEADLASAKQSGGAQDVVSRARSGPRIKKEVLRKNIESNLEALRKARAKSGVGGGKTRGAVAPLVTKEEALLIKEIALDYARLGTATLEDVVKAVKQAIKDTLGVEYADQDIIDAIAEPGEKRTRSELAARIAELKRQARSQSTGTKAEIAVRNEILRLRKIDKAKAAALEAKSKREFGEMWRYQDRVLKYEEEIARLQNEIKEGRFLKPSKKISQVDENLQRLRAERDVYASKVKGLIRQNEQSKLLRRVREGAGVIRSSILGSDIGVLTRQGLFSWSNPKIAIKGTKDAVKSAFSEVEAAKAMRLINERRIDGKLAAVARKKAGLSLTDFASNPEELSATLLIKKLPIIGKTIGGSLERFQHVFINQVRADTFDRALKLGYSADELKARARFINNATGRGNIKNVPAALEAALTSPRYEASRWGLIAEPARNIAGIARKDGKWALNRGARDNLKDMAVTAAEIYGLFKVAELAGYETNLTDSTSPDFLKLRKGDEVWDVSAGLAPRIVDILRLVAYIREPGYNKDIGALIDRAGTRTISPAVRTPLTFLSVQYQKSKGKSFTAEKDEDKVKSPFSGFTVEEWEAGWLAFMPLIFQSFLKTLEEEGMGEASWAALREFIGQSVSRYPKPE